MNWARVTGLRGGWAPYRVVSYESWCGHTQEALPFPRRDRDGSVLFVPVPGEAR